ncbi:MAG: hypothetical protein Q4C72_06300 [Eubacteriales bacterium]|nr:hypothetical protein [Eubacteriales bacterium]
MKDLIWGCTLVVFGTICAAAALFLFSLGVIMIERSGGVSLLCGLILLIVGALLVIKGKNAVHTAALIENSRSKD